MHSYLRSRLIGEFHARAEDKDSKLKEKALEKAQEWERRQEEDLIFRLMDQHESGGLAVLGIEPTIEALMLGQVHTLIIDHNSKQPGMICPHDHQLSTYLENCPICGQKMQPVEDILDEMVEEALAQKSEVEHVFLDHEAFKPYGVGALLRFKI